MGMPPKKLGKIEAFLVLFHDFQPIFLMYQLNLNDNASFTSPKT